MHAAGIMGPARDPAECMNHQLTVTTQVWSSDPTSSQSVAHLLKPSLDAFVTSAYYRELKYFHSNNGFENVVYKMIT